MPDTVYVLGFSAFPGIGTKRFEKLVTTFGSSQKAWEAEEQDLLKILGQQIGKKFFEFRKTFDLQKYAQELQQKNIYFFTPSDAAYPVLLRSLAHPPFILFAKGNVSLLQNDRAVGVVGTRKVTSYGREVTEMFAADLVSHDVIIISGMALGVDAVAHTTAVKQKGKTIAVLGSGVDTPTPREHAYLYQQILDTDGLIVSTFSPGEDANRGSFPARNAIIAGLSQAIVVTEGAEDSGSLITAQYAKKFNRFVFSVPGQITSLLSKGTNNLIKQGAIPVSSGYDIIKNLQTVIPNSFRDLSSGKMLKQVQHDEKRKVGTKEEQAIVELLKSGPLLFDEIVRTIGKESKEVGSLLSVMELRGTIKNLSDGKYMLSS